MEAPKLTNDHGANFRGITSFLRDVASKLSELFGRLRNVEEAVKTIPTMGGSGSTSTASGDVIEKAVSQVAHGFVIGNTVHLNGSTWEKADRDDATKVCDGIVSDVADNDNFTVAIAGWVTATTGEWDALTGGSGGLTAGDYYWLSSTAGGLTSTKPATGLAQVVLVAVSTTDGIVSIGDVVDLSASSGGNSVLATVDFGASFTHYTSVSVAATWVAADSEIVVTPLAVAGQEIEYTLMSFSPVVSDLSAGVGFTLHVYTPIEAKGTYQFSCVGV